MNRTIILAAKLYEHHSETRLMFYCCIPEVKEGYMALNVGQGRADYGFWSGLRKVVGLLHRTYRSYGIQLAVSKSALSLHGLADKDQVSGLLNEFVSYAQTTCDPYTERLDLLNDISIVDQIQPGVLKGYSLEAVTAAQLNPPVVVKEKAKKYDYYSELTMPDEGVVLDFETTSPIVEYAKIIEISALKFRNGQIIDQFQTLVNPKLKISKQIRELTGITDEDVAGMPTSFQAVKQLNKFLAGTPVLVGHNVQYDYRVLKAICDRANIRVWTGKLLCTIKQARELKLPISSYDLSTLCEQFDIINERPHRAWADTKATFELMKCIYQSHLV
ncbi:PolC-type DNA polymerase III [Paenibacillus sp. CF384]|uniref:3'-5' exonuclease n=1 Tax=Paenibacillus sp. CF384 TaxID=1884382 RepID=UPI00089B864E|nr:3'-5' exonuclease [Paenibacillus sp. CF384]SDX70395.1 Exonuclease [Paenibacillus sp. CF384]